MDLFRKKSPDHLIAEAAAPDRQMKRALGPFALTCIGIGAIIGTGIFALAGTASARGKNAALVLEKPLANFIQTWVAAPALVFCAPRARPGGGCCFVF